ncbi:hypothetical protein DB356_03965 [Pseudomonas congelans]|uniref:GrlR family regulatory protein n=1 Tax=Pseudomonas congelans TaxID=200452 RepID=UPI001BDCDFAD|nr:GrlR family regulatory protein [Pseudomonas congelans]QVX13919.1 hypothetical protein DB356_03965 [Pseudomonas congelans]
MKDGLYAVNFKSSSQDFGSGVLSVKNGSVNGGDHGYFYQGQIVKNESKLSGTIQIKQWNRSVPSVFGPIPNLTFLWPVSLKGIILSYRARLLAKPSKSLAVILRS